MASPTLELIGKIVVRLKDWEPLDDLVANRIYDDIPSSAVFPYISIGPTQEIRDDADCIDASEIFVQVDAWSRSIGAPEVYRIANEIRRALHDYEVDLSTNALVMLEHRTTRRMRDPDGTTNHAVIEMAAIIELTTP